MTLKFPASSRSFRQIIFSDVTRLLWFSIPVGISTALLIYGYHLGIEAFHELFQEGIAHDLLGPIFGAFGLVVAVALAGLIVGFLMQRFVGHERYHGVTSIIESVALTGGRLPYRKMPFKALASMITLGAGGSSGPEDPSVQIGSNFASWLGQRTRLSEEEVRLLVAAGAASAIAAAFNAPIAGVFFALEVVLNGAFNSSAFGSIVLSAVIASAVTNAVYGTGTEAVGPLNYLLIHPIEILLYIPLGVLLAAPAAGFIRLVYWQRDLWHRLDHRIPAPVKTALAGVLVGLVGIVLPQILGTGRETMNAVLAGELHFGFWLLIVIGLVKMLMTSITLAGGFVGGVFAPALFIGTMLGSAYGQAMNALLPGVDPQAYAIAGMAGMMSGVLRAPITAIMIVFELTSDYRLILPIMLTTIICMVLAERLCADGIYKIALTRAGVHLREGIELDVMQTVKVGDVMHKPASAIPQSASLLQLRDYLRSENTRGVAVVDDEGRLVGVVTMRDLQAAFERDHNPDAQVKEIMTPSPFTAYPFETVWTALTRMGAANIGRLPVVDTTTGELIGMFRRQNIIKAYNMSITRRAAEQHQAEHLRLQTLSGAHVIEIPVSDRSMIADKRIAEIIWPADSVIAAIRRHGKLIVPHGHTEIQAGDVLTIVAEPEAEKDIAVIATRVREPEPSDSVPESTAEEPS
jgi:chloride channel protein, CIC family